jgi:hypothetical protein
VKQPISIDYTNLGYESLREAMLSLARQNLPEWTDFSESDLGVLLVELFAYACDITLYYQTRIANNLFPETADEPDALVQLLRLIGYELRPPAPALAELALGFDGTTLLPDPIQVPAGTLFNVALSNGTSVSFESQRTVNIALNQLTLPDARKRRYFLGAPVVQGVTVTDSPVPGGLSDGTPNQMYTLSQKSVIDGSIQVNITESTGLTTHWLQVNSIANSSPADRHFIVQRGADGTATILFGDGINGLIPPASTPTAPVSIQATYRVGGGTQGNVPARTQFKPASSLPGNVTIVDAYNPAPAAGGSDLEDIDRARSFAPRLFRTQDRAVTTQDYIDLALQVPGVGKALAVATGWNGVKLYIAPFGQVTDPSESLQRDLLAFLESRRMLTTNITIVGPVPADIYIQATVFARPYFLQSDVQTRVVNAVASYLSFDAVDFGQAIYLSKVYDIIQNLPEVDHLTITQFSRSAGVDGVGVNPPGVIQLASNELPRPGYASSIQLVMQGGVLR